MKRKSRSFFRRNKFLVLFLIMIIGYYGYSTVQTNKKLVEYRTAQAELKTEIESLESELEQLNDTYEYTQTPEAIERIAREKLKMVKPNEIIYLIRTLNEKDSD
jgi:cell division protein FtsL